MARPDQARDVIDVADDGLAGDRFVVEKEADAVEADDAPVPAQALI